MYSQTTNGSTTTTDYDVDSNGNLFSHTQTVTDTYTPVDVGGFQPQIVNLQSDIDQMQAQSDKITAEITDKQTAITNMQATAKQIVTAVPTLADQLNALANPIVATPPVKSPADPAPVQ